MRRSARRFPIRVCDGRSDALASNLRTNGFLWFDGGCFPVPAVGYFGNSGRTVLDGPGINNWDLGFEKRFLLARQSTRLMMRVETFNTWNHAQFEQPNGNAGAPAIFGGFPLPVRHGWFSSLLRSDGKKAIHMSEKSLAGLEPHEVDRERLRQSEN